MRFLSGFVQFCSVRSRMRSSLGLLRVLLEISVSNLESSCRNSNYRTMKSTKVKSQFLRNRLLLRLSIRRFNGNLEGGKNGLRWNFRSLMLKNTWPLDMIRINNTGCYSIKNSKNQSISPDLLLKQSK